MKAASLSGHLLARKGDARPALAPARDAIGHLVEQSPAPEPVAQARPMPQVRGIATIMRPSLEHARDKAVNGHNAAVAPPLHAVTGGGGPGVRETVRLSVRMGRERHRKLRILAAQRGLSLQQAMIQAIDALVASAAGQADTRNCACLGDPDRCSEQPSS